MADMMNHEKGVDNALGGGSVCHTTFPSACSKHLSRPGIRHLHDPLLWDDHGGPPEHSSHSAISRSRSGSIETVILPMGAKSNEEGGPKLRSCLSRLLGGGYRMKI